MLMRIYNLQYPQYHIAEYPNNPTRSRSQPCFQIKISWLLYQLSIFDQFLQFLLIKIRETCLMSQKEVRMDPNQLNDEFLFSYKMDRMYVNALKRMKKSAFILTTLQLLKAIYLAAVVITMSRTYPIQDNSFFPPLTTAAGLSLIMVMIYIILIGTTKNLAKNLMLAKDLDHIVEQPYDKNLRLNVFADSVSTVYNAGNPEDNIVNDMLESNLSEIIKYSYITERSELDWMLKVADLSLFGISVWLAVLLGIKEIQNTWKVLIILYIIVEFVHEWKLVFVTIVIVVSPIILGVICCFVCCCMSNQRKDLTEILNPIDFQESVQLNHGVECLICFTNFYPGQKICILECPAKHAFHQICIKGWFQVGTTCPSCRHNFAPAEQQ